MKALWANQSSKKTVAGSSWLVVSYGADKAVYKAERGHTLPFPAMVSSLPISGKFLPLDGQVITCFHFSSSQSAICKHIQFKSTHQNTCPSTILLTVIPIKTGIQVCHMT
jgi:hypothetical protein